MDDIKVYDHFLDYKDYHLLKDAFCSDSKDRAPFFYNDNIVSENELKDDYSFQFTHAIYDTRWFSGSSPLYDTSPYIDLLDPIFVKLKVKKLFKAKVNIRTRTSKIYRSEYHVDIIEKIEGHKTAIYYLNTNDGYTLFKSGEKVKSVGNRLVVFDGQLYHFGTTCTDQNIRSVLNINYI